MRPAILKVILAVLELDDTVTAGEREAILAACGEPSPDILPVGRTPAETALPDAWMSSEDAARHIGLTAKTVREGAARGNLPGHKYPMGSIRGKWRFLRTELDEWLKPVVAMPILPASGRQSLHSGHGRATEGNRQDCRG